MSPALALWTNPKVEDKTDIDRTIKIPRFMLTPSGILKAAALYVKRRVIWLRTF